MMPAASPAAGVSAPNEETSISRKGRPYPIAYELEALAISESFPMGNLDCMTTSESES